MILARRVVPFFGIVLVAGSYTGLLLNPERWQLWSAIILLWVLGSVLFLLHWRPLSLAFWAALMPLAVLLCGGTGVLFFLDVAVSRWIFAVVLVLLYGVYTETLFVYHYQPQLYTNLSLPRLSLYLITIGSVCLFSFFWALHLIGALSVWLLVVLAMVIMAAIMLHILYSYQLWSDENLVLVLLTALLFGEVAWVLQYWPAAFYVNGMVMGLVVYLVPSIVLMQLRGALNRRVLWRYAMMSIIALVLILTTTQWT